MMTNNLERLAAGERVMMTRKLPPLSEHPQTVMSVPHSGTRTLVEHLGIYAGDSGLPGGKWWHFGMHPELLDRFIDKGLHLHVPLRNPMRVARSWATRGARLRHLGALITAYEHMFETQQRLPPDRISFYKMELFPRAEWQGTDDNHAKPDGALIADFQWAVMNRVVLPQRAFFKPHYPELCS